MKINECGANKKKHAMYSQNKFKKKKIIKTNKKKKFEIFYFLEFINE